MSGRCPCLFWKVAGGFRSPVTSSKNAVLSTQTSTAQEYATYLDALGVERRRADVAQKVQHKNTLSVCFFYPRVSTYL